MIAKEPVNEPNNHVKLMAALDKLNATHALLVKFASDYYLMCSIVEDGIDNTDVCELPDKYVNLFSTIVNTPPICNNIMDYTANTYVNTWRNIHQITTDAVAIIDKLAAANVK